MKANRLNLGVVLAELSNDFIDQDLMEEAKKRSKGIESTVLKLQTAKDGKTEFELIIVRKGGVSIDSLKQAISEIGLEN